MLYDIHSTPKSKQVGKVMNSYYIQMRKHRRGKEEKKPQPADKEGCEQEQEASKRRKLLVADARCTRACAEEILPFTGSDKLLRLVPLTKSRRELPQDDVLKIQRSNARGAVEKALAG